jgi:hypothetical protein
MDSAIQLIQENLDIITRDPALLRDYEGYEKAERDYASGINAARREGLLQGEQTEIRSRMPRVGVPSTALRRDRSAPLSK